MRPRQHVISCQLGWRCKRAGSGLGQVSACPVDWSTLWLQASAVSEELLKTEYDAARILYNRFVSAIAFKPTLATVLSPDVRCSARFVCPLRHLLCPPRPPPPPPLPPPPLLPRGRVCKWALQGRIMFSALHQCMHGHEFTEALTIPPSWQYAQFHVPSFASKTCSARSSLAFGCISGLSSSHHSLNSIGQC